MCKMVFIGTDCVLEEIPVDENYPGFSIQKIDGEFLTVADKFSGKNIYYVATGRGCGCDFGIYGQSPPEIQTPSLAIKISEVVDKIFRRSTGTNNQNHKSNPLPNNNFDPGGDTLRLIGIIDSIIRKENFVELYCCWSGDYADCASEEITLNFREEDLRKSFIIMEGQKVTFAGN